MFFKQRSLIFILLAFPIVLLGQLTLKGKIVDKTTRNPVLFATVTWQKTGLGTVSDQYGKFIVSLPSNHDTLIINSIGYQQFKVSKQEAINNPLFAILSENVKLEKVVVKKKGRIKRNRKTNPAYLLHKQIVKHKKQNDIKQLNGYECKVYNKVEIDLNNVDSTTKELTIFKPIEFLFKDLDTSSMPKPFVPIFMSEGMSEYYYRNDPPQEKEIIKASKIAGLEIKSLNQFTGNLYVDYNIYQEYINLFQKSLISPLADQAWLSYNFYLTDSLKRNDSTFYRLDFFPRRKHDLAFKGFLWVDTTSYGINKIHLELAADANINFVHLFKIDLLYQLKNSVWVPKEENILIDFYLTKLTQGFYGKKKSYFSKYIVNKPKSKSFYKNAEKLVVWDSLDTHGNNYMDNNRPAKLTKTEQNTYNKVDSAMQTPYMRLIKNITQTLVTGYYPFKYFEYGRYYTAYSFNKIEGNRYRIGGLTTPSLLPKTRFGGYGAWSTANSRIKFQAEITQYYKLKKLRYFKYTYTYDYRDISASKNAFLHDNILATAFRRTVPRLTFVNQHHFEWFHEWFLGINNHVHVDIANYEPNAILNYQKPDGSLLNRLDINSIKVGGRLAMDEKFVTYGFRRLSLATRKPALDYFYTHGFKIGGIGFNFHKVNLSLQDRWYLGYVGYIDTRITASKIWGELPYPFLINHTGNDSYYHNNQAFNLMNPFEFVSDQHLSMLLTHHFNGMVLNHIPLIKKLHWRTLVFARGVIGNLNYNHENQILFPTTLGPLNEPYVEVGTGLENIFKAIRIDILWRLTNNSSPAPVLSYNFGFYPTF